MACVQVSMNFATRLVSLVLCSCFSVDHNLRAALHKDVLVMMVSLKRLAYSYPVSLMIQLTI